MAGRFSSFLVLRHPRIADCFTAVKHLYQLPHRAGALPEGFELVSPEVELDDLLDAACAELDGDADEEILDAVPALQAGGAGEDTLQV